MLTVTPINATHRYLSLNVSIYCCLTCKTGSVQCGGVFFFCLSVQLTSYLLLLLYSCYCNYNTHFLILHFTILTTTSASNMRCKFIKQNGLKPSYFCPLKPMLVFVRRRNVNMLLCQTFTICCTSGT